MIEKIKSIVIALLALATIGLSGTLVLERSETNSLKNQLEVSKNKLSNCNTTVKVCDVEKPLNEGICQSQIDSFTTTLYELQERNKEINNLYDKARKTLSKSEQERLKLVQENESLKSINIIETPPMTEEEADEVVKYMDTPVPVHVEQLLHIPRK